jgi:hypothetical protein
MIFTLNNIICVKFSLRESYTKFMDPHQPRLLEGKATLRTPTLELVAGEAGKLFIVRWVVFVKIER